MPLTAFMDHVRDEMNYHVRTFDVVGPDGTAWSTVGNSFGGLVLKAQTFIDGRKMGLALGRHHRPPRIAAADRRNPEKHRVIEDDCRIQPLSASRSGYSEDDPW
ncbi:hypothetical protein MAPG_08853 [Magnaporthiopsis poae ATCC 64411]|uniref:Uncharacterized protein n=1 Tax=Magnaporthiopsis poae (strain ATCC 64411 / 73-15) TaxID=644358 RepID=A0A0C4E8F2_MAGP6|nr:hypothetical protein MAPG_08853 [Magnaporthiopsis poae ATCC 64411]